MRPARLRLGTRVKVAWCCLLALISFSVAACGGSALSPQEVLTANNAISGSNNSGNGNGSSSNGSTGTGTGTANSGGSGGSTTGTGSNGSGGTTGTGNTGTTSGGGGGSKGTGGTPPATAGLPVGSCAGFQNGPGITSSTITIGNASDISGPVNGLFTSTQQAVKAYVAYFNATSNICGRKLALVTQDSRTDPGADQVAYQSLCSSSFAAVGSMSAYDNGGAQTAQSCGLPDLRTAITTDEAAACTTCFAAQASNANYYENAPFSYFFQKDPSLKAHVGIVYLNAGGAAQNASTMQSVAQKLGASVTMEAVSVQDLSYDSYVQSLKSNNVQYVIFLGPYQDTIKLQQSMQTNGFSPKVFVQDPSIYDPGYVSMAKSSGIGNGTYVFTTFLPFSLASQSREMQNYLTWLQQAAPGATPSFFGVFAWSAAALFVREAIQLGGKLNRSSLVNAIRGVHNWTDYGVTSPQDVGGKINPSCVRFMRLENYNWQILGGYQCLGVTHK